MFIPQYELLFGKTKFNSDYTLDRSFTGTTAPYYWVASTYVYAGDNSISWGMRQVDSWNPHCLNYSGLMGSSGNTGDANNPVRPIVTLTSDIQLKWNDIDGEWKIQ